MGSESTIVTSALLLWGSGFLILGRIRMRGPHVATQHSGASLSVIIPARNEEHNLPALLASLNAQSVRPQEIIVVDDASTDRTADVARSFGATVISSQPLPADWRGKTWACQQGADAAHGDTLLFVDADTWIEAFGLERILADKSTGALSAVPYHEVRLPYEQLSVFFNLIMTAATLPDGLFGQMLLVSREDYRRVGGHGAVKGRILENFHLAERFREEGIPLRSIPGKGMLSFRMYPNGPSDQRIRIRGEQNAWAAAAAHRSVVDRHGAAARAASVLCGGRCGLSSFCRTARDHLSASRRISLVHGVVLSCAAGFLLRCVRPVRPALGQAGDLERTDDPC